MKVCIVGGGSAGWMTATTFCNVLDYDVTLVESPDIPVSGVGESTIQQIREWIEVVGIHEDEKEFLRETNGTIKHSIKFTNFLEKDSGSFHYPFGLTINDPAAFWSLYMHSGELSPNEYAYYTNYVALLAEKGKVNIPWREGAYAYHFDSIKFGQFLRKKYCSEVNHITANVIDCQKFEDGIKSIHLDTGENIEADLFIDCTGFKSLLLGQFLKEPFISFTDLLPNDRAWATHVPHSDKENMQPITECTAIENGWVWNIPLWDKIGTGYVYSSKYISDEDAKKEFINHLKSKGLDTEGEYKLIPMRIGRHERTWVGNVIAIGLSAGFLEPLESNGLLMVHENLLDLYKTLRRGEPSALIKQYYNSAWKVNYDTFAEFLVIHYSFSQRKDTPYWRDIFNKEYDQAKSMFENLYGMYGLCAFGRELYQESRFIWPTRGLPYIASGMNVCPFTGPTLTYQECLPLKAEFKKWNETVQTYPTMYNYLKENIYKD